MSTISHIVVPVDLSAASLSALRYAAFLSEHNGAVLHLLHVCREDARGGSGRQALDALLADTPHVFARVAGVDTLLGDPAPAIVEVARAYRADVIVMGKCSDEDADTSLTGNVLAAVAAHAECAVVGVHAPASATADFALCQPAAAKPVAAASPSARRRALAAAAATPRADGPHVRH